MSRGHGRGRGDGNRREISALQTELQGKSIFSKNGDRSNGFPEYDIVAGRAASEEEKHIADLMEKFRAEMQSSVFCLRPPAPARDVERYSDRYFKPAARQSLKGLKTDVGLFPDELHSELLKKSTKGKKTAVYSGNGLLDALKDAKDDDDDEGAGDKSGSDAEKTDKEDGDEELGDEDEDDEEEGNDYLESYFENGEEDDLGDLDDDDGGGGGDY
ncbi:hypothetical protein IWW37_001068 [Coemansia sp. RSA 2050]|nr:hypothetical protein IWW37_001068 [Coemansia sp. RSA 2050]KAJ2737059.1 hypothetical protein IW152_000322 [Coemansia sp. BCRC 34962]